MQLPLPWAFLLSTHIRRLFVEAVLLFSKGSVDESTALCLEQTEAEHGPKKVVPIEECTRQRQTCSDQRATKQALPAPNYAIKARLIFCVASPLVTFFVVVLKRTAFSKLAVRPNSSFCPRATFQVAGQNLQPSCPCYLPIE